MLSFNKSSRILALATVLMLALAGVAMAYTSFMPQRTSTDTTGDGGIDKHCLPEGAEGALLPYGPGESGWDIDEVGLAYDRANDKLFVGISAYNGIIVGDVDGNGDPGGTHACLAAAGGADLANLGSAESVDFIIDAGTDGIYDYIVGTPFGLDITGFTVAEFVGYQPPLSFPGNGYGDPAGTGSVTNNPTTTSAPDFEFVIESFSGLLGLTPGDTLDFCFVARAGSLSTDAGFGEDMTGAKCVTFGLGSIGDYVWVDEPSPNGIQDGTEFGLDGIRVYLYEDEDGDGEIDAEDDLISTVTTANGGKYLFENLPAGNYIVKVDDEDIGNEGLSPVPRYQGDDTSKDSNGSTSTPYTSESVSLATGEDNLTIDFGYYLPPTAVTLSSFAAKSSAGGSGSWLWLGLAGLTVLAAGSSLWIRRQSRQGKIV
jgi:hypothetical protein